MTEKAGSEKRALPKIPGKIINDANNSRPGSLEPLRKLLDLAPTLQLRADPASVAEHAVVRAASGGNVLVGEITRRELGALRARLSRANDGELEQLLIERVVLAWIAVTNAEALRAEKWAAGPIERSAADFWDRHVSRLNADFLRACKTLAQVRRLLVPVVGQVNVAQPGAQQVNVVAASELSPGVTER